MASLPRMACGVEPVISSINTTSNGAPLRAASATLPMLSSAGKDGLDLLFSIPEGRRIVAIKLGELTVGTVDLEVK